MIAPQVTKYSDKYDAYYAAREDGTLAEKFPEYILMRHECNQNPYATTVYEPATGKMVANQDSARLMLTQSTLSSCSRSM